MHCIVIYTTVCHAAYSKLYPREREAPLSHHIRIRTVPNEPFDIKRFVAALVELAEAVVQQREAETATKVTNTTEPDDE